MVPSASYSISFCHNSRDYMILYEPSSRRYQREREWCLRLLIVLLYVIVTEITDLYINTAAAHIRMTGMDAFGLLLYIFMLK